MWIKKNNFKDIDDELSDQIDKLSVLQSDKDKLINKINSYKTNLKSLKESLDIVNGQISKVNKKAFLKDNLNLVLIASKPRKLVNSK